MLTPFKRYALLTAWLTNVILIFVLCIWGRPLQHWVQSLIPLTYVGYVVTAFLAIVVLILLVKQARIEIN